MVPTRFPPPPPPKEQDLPYVVRTWAGGRRRLFLGGFKAFPVVPKQNHRIDVTAEKGIIRLHPHLRQNCFCHTQDWLACPKLRGFMWCEKWNAFNEIAAWVINWPTCE